MSNNRLDTWTAEYRAFRAGYGACVVNRDCGGVASLAVAWRSYSEKRALDCEPVSDEDMELHAAAWSYELATTFNKKTGEYGGWKPYLTTYRPAAAVGAMRNLKPLKAIT